MNRRTNDCNGFVNFPIDNSDFKSSHEGGMFVRLVVHDPENNWMQCCGGQQCFHLDECFQADDVHGIDNKYLLEEGEKENDVHVFHFPNINDVKTSDFMSMFEGKHTYNEFERTNNKYRSIPYLCIMTIGSTGWSGWNETKGEYWHCKYNDLTDEGKKIYDNLKMLYAGCNIYLQTWLDT